MEVALEAVVEVVVVAVTVVVIESLNIVAIINAYNTHMWPGLRKQGMWAQITPCLSKGHISVLEQSIFVL